MRATTLLLSTIVLLFLGAGTGLRAEDEDSEREIRERYRLMNETVAIQLLEGRVRAQRRWTEALLELTGSYAKALSASQQETASGVGILKRRIEQLEEALATERARTGLDENELMKQLIAEQKRHTVDVIQLQLELAKRHEMAESNRLEATDGFQRAQLHEERSQVLRKQLVQAIWLLGETGSAAKAALPWLKQSDELEDEAVSEAAKEAIGKIEAGG